jgi:hypothetical protein
MQHLNLSQFPSSRHDFRNSVDGITSDAPVAPVSSGALVKWYSAEKD